MEVFCVVSVSAIVPDVGPSFILSQIPEVCCMMVTLPAPVDVFGSKHSICA